MNERLTLATSSGLPLLALAFHVAMGTAALVAGWVAITAKKGATWHRQAGRVYVWTMIAMGLSAVGIAVYERKEDVAVGALTAYLVFTGWTAIRPLPRSGRQAGIAMMLFALALAVMGYADAFTALGRPGRHIDGVPAFMIFFFSTIILLAAVGDARVLHEGGIVGTRRIARHLWRMSFGLFIASGSFVTQLVRMEFMPDWTRSVPVILALSAGPLVVLLYWMWRIRLRHNLRGLTQSIPFAGEAGA